MYTGLAHLHSILRWFALIAIVVAIVISFRGMRTEMNFGRSANRWSLFTLIAFHLQLVVGLALYFLGGWADQLGEMGDKLVRFYSLEHMVAMVLAIALVTVGRIRSKKGSSHNNKFRRLFWPYFIAFIIVMVNIPWPFREVIGRPWFPGM